MNFLVHLSFGLYFLVHSLIIILQINKESSFFVVSQSSFTQATGNIAYEQFTDNAFLNDVRMIAQISNDVVLMCGNHDRDWLCLRYKWSGLHFNQVLEKFHNLTIGKQLIRDQPYGEKSKTYPIQKSSFAYKYSNGYMYSAMPDENRGFPSIARVAVRDYEVPTSQQTLFSDLETLNETDWLNDPYFVGMVDAGDKMFIFFREEVMEAVDFSEKVVVSRVAQVCKNDTGGRGTLEGKWTSFFKARLNCSVPGGRPFYFNELQHITEAVLIDGEPTVFATFTTPENSITGSAVCAFTLASVEDAMNGPFRKVDLNKSGGWELVNKPSVSSPTACHQGRKSDEILSFIKEHRFMAEGVPAITPSPLVISTQDRYSAISVEVNPDLKIAMLYIGTAEGKLMKLAIQQGGEANSTRKIVLSETWEVYRHEDCSLKSSHNGARLKEKVLCANEDCLKRVQKIILLSEHILVAFKHCVISVPKKACWHYKCERSCVQSGNPYCRWKSNGYCVPVSSAKTEIYEQDLFQEKRFNHTCEGDGTMMPEESCPSTLEIVLPLVLGLTVIFTIVLFLVICRERRRKKYSGKARLNNPKLRHNKKMCKGQRTLLVRHSKDDPLHVTIEATTPIEPSIYDRPKIGSPQPLNNLNMNCNYGSAAQPHMTLHKEQLNSSCDDTEWSEEFEGSTDHLAEKVCKTLKPLDGSNNLFYYNEKGQKSSLLKLKSHSFSSPSKVRLGANYGSLLSHTSTKNSKCFEKSRIVTNPNYLPVTPYIVRNADSAKPNVSEINCRNTNVTSPELSTFSSKWEQTEQKKLISESNNNFDINFPRPPSCVLQNSHNFSTIEPKSFPLKPLSGFDQMSEISSTTTIEGRKTSISSSSKMSYCLSPDDIPAPSYAGSTTSGFVSSTSPQDPTISPSSRRAIIVAKGILSAQSTLASPRTRRIKKKKRRSGEKCGSSNEHIYDEPFNPASALDEMKENYQVSSDSSENRDSKKVIFPSPEFLQQSEDDYDDIQKTATPAGFSRDEISMSRKSSKKRLHRSGKSKKDKFLEEINDESFTSPAFDEEPDVPVVEGWQEINYNPRFSTLQSNDGSHYYDDSCLSKNSNHLNNSGSPFYTMRPKNRMRYQMPKLRNTNKEWSSYNNPVPVPTPAIPDM